MSLNAGGVCAMKSDRGLKRIYRSYNRRFFDGQLPDAFIWWEVPAGAYADCQLIDGVWRVRINPSLAGWPSIARWSLLHEQAHIKLHPNRNHGRKFQQEMLRLAEAGAFVGLW